MLGKYLAAGILALGISASCSSTNCKSRQNDPHRVYSFIPPDTSFAVVLEKYGRREEGFRFPHYKVGIMPNGEVIYAGAENVLTRGIRKSRVDEPQLRGIISIAEKLGYFNMKPFYLTRLVPGQKQEGISIRVSHPPPITRTTINIRCPQSRGIIGTNSIATIDGANPDLDSLENMIEQVADSQRWTKPR
jgi:hypothetical protein